MFSFSSMNKKKNLNTSNYSKGKIESITGINNYGFILYIYLIGNMKMIDYIIDSVNLIFQLI